MAIEKIADYLYISSQLNQGLIRQIVQYEIKTVICNRPDGEDSEQANFEVIKGWLTLAGVEKVVYLPVTLDGLNDEILTKFQDTIAQSPAPILAYCRTGTRCAIMWVLNQMKRGVSVGSLIKAAELANINLNPYRDKLELIAQQMDNKAFSKFNP